jgi:Na+/H+ antiporter NhaD/arsenite permease-like protein
VLTITIFAATYAVIAFGRLPGLRIDRTGAALLGGALMVATGAIPLEEPTARSTGTRSPCCWA